MNLNAKVSEKTNQNKRDRRAKEKMDDEDSDHEDMDNESDYPKMSKEKAIKKIADYLKKELHL